jgi:thioredoxin reductase
MIDLEGFAAMWGRSVFICPYCHGWEVQDRRLGVLAHQPEQLELALMLRGWSAEVVVLTGGALPIPAEPRARLAAGGVAIDERPLRRLLGEDGVLHAVEFVDGAQRPLEALFARPPQSQQPLVAALGLALDGQGFVQVDPMRRETSTPGIYAAGDLCTPMQAAAAAVGQGMHAAAALNHELTVELALAGALPPAAGRA